MNYLFSILFSLTLILSSAGALAHDSYEPRLQSAKYELAHVDDVLKELDYVYNEVAPAGFSKKIVRELHVRLMGAQKLISDILLDEKLSDEKKDEYLSQLVPDFGAAWLKVFRFQKEDSLIDVRVREYAGNPEVKEALEKIAKAERGSPEWSDANDDLIETLNGLEAQGVQPISAQGGAMVKFLRGAWRAGRNIGKEALMDFKAVFSYRKTAKMERIWTLVNRGYRDSASQDAVRTIADLTLQTLPNVKEGDILDTQRTYWMKKLVHVMRLRSDRLLAQKTMVYTYFGIAMSGFLFPLVDWVAMIDGGWSENSLWVSGSSYLIAWSVVGGLKFASYSKRTVEMLQSVRDLLQASKPADDATLANLNHKSLFDRLMRVWPEKICELTITPEKGGKK